MYSENNRRCATGRADGEFLRRMTGGEPSCPLPASMPRCALGSDSKRGTPMRDARVRVNCNGSPVTITREQGDSRCERGTSCAPCSPDSFAPSLAMVYSPRQCWKNVLSPEEGLCKGTIFSELVLPLEAGNKHAKEVTIRRPM